MRPHLRVARMAVARACSLAEQSTARSTPRPPVRPADLGDVIGSAGQDFVAEFEVERELHALLHNVDADNLVRAQLSAERASGQSHGAQTGDQHRMIAADADLFQTFIHRAETAGHLGAIGIGQRVGEVDQVLLFGEQEFGHAAIALPAVGAAIFFAGAGDHVAAAAIVAHATAGDVIHDDAVAHGEAAASGAGLHDLAAGLVACHHALVTFRTLAQMLVINAADVRAADGGRLHAKQHFAVAGYRNRHLFQYDGAIAGEERAFHCSIAQFDRSLFDLSIQIPEIFPGLVLFPQEDLPFDEAAVPVDDERWRPYPPQ